MFKYLENKIELNSFNGVVTVENNEYPKVGDLINFKGNLV
jgi:hypothetical protein